MTAAGDGQGDDDGTTAGWSRRRFLASSGLAAGGLALGLGACSDDDSSGSSDGSGPATGDGRSASTTRAGGGRKAGTPDPETGIVDADVPTEAVIYGWISKVFQP